MKLRKNVFSLKGILIVAIVIANVFTTKCYAVTDEDRYQFFIEKEKYQDAFKLCKKIAEQGNVDAQNNLGTMYAKGIGVQTDYSEAFKLYINAAKLGFAQAQYNVGVMFAYGQGVTQDFNNAVSWLKKASEQGVAEAQFNLGVLYSNGQGVKQDYSKAKYYFGLACDNKHKNGCNMANILKQY